MRKGKIYFEEMADMVITGTFQLAGNIAPVNIMASPLAAWRRTIESLRNQVKILVEHDKDDKAAAKYEVVATAQDEESVTKYGLLEDVYKIDAEDAAEDQR
ncbi:hypothetical protein ACHHV8_00085 [Paenibacillus sp. TAB 01]|uniref:XkdQ/YqbQ family protein n=1 Tax=Paenibacillus sp. TAB 01 TaxID=3368988 RepID=UPI003750342D